MNAVGSVAEPPTVATLTLTDPAEPAGAFAVASVPPVEATTVVARELPNVTVEPVRCVPVMTTPANPTSGPADGVTVEIVGAAT